MSAHIDNTVGGLYIEYNTLATSLGVGPLSPGPPWCPPGPSGLEYSSPGRPLSYPSRPVTVVKGNNQLGYHSYHNYVYEFLVCENNF